MAKKSPTPSTSKTTPAAAAAANRLRRLARQWLAVRKAEGLAPGTLKNDRTSLERFCNWLATERGELAELVAVDARVLEDYAVWLSVYESEDGRHVKAATRARHLMTLRGFFVWLETWGKVLRSPARELKLPRVDRPLPRGVLSSKEVARVLAAPDTTTLLGLRDRALVELVYSTGLRNTEVRRLKLDDLSFTDEIITVRRGKGGRSRVVPMGMVAGKYLRRYLKKARPQLVRRHSDDTVFLTRTGTGLSRDGVGYLMRRIAERVGLTKKLTCHGLRHTCATHLLRGRADIRHIQELLGHRYLSSTQVYTQVAAKDLKRVHARCHPRERKERAPDTD